MAKIEWEKRLISQFLDVIPKLFQIRRVCVKIIDNNPFSKEPSKELTKELSKELSKEPSKELSKETSKEP